MTAQEVPKTAPRRGPDAGSEPIFRALGPKRPPGGPKRPPGGPQAPGDPQEAPKRLPRGRKKPDNGPQQATKRAPRGFGTASRRPSSLEPRETYHLPRDPNELSRCFHEDESQTPRRFQSCPRPKTQDGTKNIKGAEKGRLKGPRDHKEGFKGQASRGRVADGKGGE